MMITGNNRPQDIPDYQNAPLSAKKHYGILKVLEKELHTELKRLGYQGHLVGFSLTYTIKGDPIPWSMAIELKARQDSKETVISKDRLYPETP